MSKHLQSLLKFLTFTYLHILFFCLGVCEVRDQFGVSEDHTLFHEDPWVTADLETPIYQEIPRCENKVHLWGTLAGGSKDCWLSVSVASWSLQFYKKPQFPSNNPPHILG